MPIIILKNNYNFCKINSLGAQILSCNIAQSELFHSCDNPRRSGVPILFPFAGALEENKFGDIEFNQHGFGRDLEWSIIARSDKSIELKLTDNDLTEKMKLQYPQEFEVIIKYQLTDADLKMSMRVYSKAESIKIAPGLHPYFDSNCVLSTELTNPVYHQLADSTGYDYADFILKLANGKELFVSDNSQSSVIVHWTNDQKYVCWEPWCRDFDGLNKDPITLKPNTSWVWRVSFEIK